MAQVFIGTSGWNYSAWKNGVFYPPELRPARWLEYYARNFGSVEVNTTFYHLPEKKVFDNWQRGTPPDFVFAVKVSRFITHMKKLAEPHLHVARFLRHASGLGEKLCVVLFQLPPFWRFNAERLRFLLEYLSRQRILPGVRVALELRHASWACEDCFDLLQRHRVALALTDWPGLTIEGPVTTDFVFVRRHGSGKEYASNYPEASLRRDARQVSVWLAAGLDVFFYFNNDAFGYAVRNALWLTELLCKNRLARKRLKRATKAKPRC